MRDVLVVTGLGMVAAGCYWHYPPLALIVPGLMLLVGGLASHFASRGKSRGDTQ